MKEINYSFLEQAAAEARAESRKYWAKGGEADRKYPVHPCRWWRIRETDDPVSAAIERMKGKRR